MNGYVDLLKRRPLESPPVAFVPTMSGAEGQSRTETGSPLLVFEFDSGRFTLSLRVPNSPVS